MLSVPYLLFRLRTVSSIAFATGSGSPSRSISCAISNLYPPWYQLHRAATLSPEENKRAMDEGFRALRYFDNVTMRGAAREALEQLEREDRIGVVLLAARIITTPA
jgi:hypothetical protein